MDVNLGGILISLPCSSRKCFASLGVSAVILGALCGIVSRRSAIGFNLMFSVYFICFDPAYPPAPEFAFVPHTSLAFCRFTVEISELD